MKETLNKNIGPLLQIVNKTEKWSNQQVLAAVKARALVQYADALITHMTVWATNSKFTLKDSVQECDDLIAYATEWKEILQKLSERTKK